ncbi:uncharacterized protein LOC119436932 isoform X2 [Dermacentor silvarum]|uniref:uncharacterized protein LOC119436932 isoform X2 n=1 Tax=Dermacentor silvarum TaxID=543639 RepID=UPI002101B159|nr:uncharacterized protein LOC119436932 isoform X2 [Dermacentor silvarum]
MTSNCRFEGLLCKRPMVRVCIALLLALTLASAVATPRQAQTEARLARLYPGVETTTEEYDYEFIEGRIVGGKPVSVLRKRAHGGGTASKTSSSASGAGSKGVRGGSSSTSSTPGSGGAKRPPSKTTGRPSVGDGLRPDSSSWRPALSGSDRPRDTNGFDNEHRGGLPNQNRESGNGMPWNHQGVSPGYPAPVTSAYTDDESPSYIPNPTATPNTYTPHNEQRPSLSSSPENSGGSQDGGGIIIGHPPTNTFSQHEGGANRPSTVPDRGNGPRFEGGLVIGSPPMNGPGSRQGGFNEPLPPQEIDQARRGVVNQQPSQHGVGSFGLPSLPRNPFVPSNPGFHVPGSLPLPFGAGLFNPGLVNIQKAVENAAAGVLGATGAGIHPTAANLFGRTSTFGQMTSFGFAERK